ncbi:hypothetical protein E2320_006320 [Naja naja]|nr:hypothetical protein E2320_006320 [Naja naja]
MKTGRSRLCGKCQWNPRHRAAFVTLPSSDFWAVVGWVFTNPYSASLILFLGCAIPASLALTMFLHYPALDIDISYNAFEIRNHESSQRFDALTLALKSQFGLWGRSRRDLADFSSETLRRLILRNCSTSSANLRGRRPNLSWAEGARGESGGPANHTSSHQSRSPLPRWEYPSATVSANTQTHAHWRIELIFLARGDAEKNIFTSERLLTIHEVERKIMDHPHFQEFCWKPHENKKSSLLRSEVLFGAPLPSYYSMDDRWEEQCRKFQNFVVTYVAWLAKESTSEEDFQERHVAGLHQQLLHCSVGLPLGIVFSCLVALFLYHIVFGIQYLGILNGVAAFVIVGIGKRRSNQIPAVHDFGLFMSLIVSCCWVGVLFTMPAALGIWSLYWSSLENTCQARCSKKCTKENALQRSDGLFVSSAVAGRSGLGTLPYLDDDIPLLNVEEEPVALEMGDVPLVSVLPENHHLTTNNDSPGHLITHLQKLLQCWALWSAVKHKWVIVGNRLRPASRAPLLFRPDTNIQVLMDLKYNLSAEGISCVTCSGLFQEKPRNLQNNIHTSLEKKKRRSGPPGSGRGSPPDDKTLQGELHLSLKIFFTGFSPWLATLSKGNSWPVTYRFSLNSTVPAPWQTVPAKDGEVPSFQVYKVPYGNFTKRLTACMSTVGHVQPGASKKWMMTSLSCDTKRGWKSDFSFYVATQEQQRTRSRFSITSGFNPCRNGNCGKPAVRPLVDTGAMVFVVFGILGVNRTRRTDNHVIGDMGSVIYDSSFDLFKEIGNLCRICKAIASNAELVKPGGAQCLPSGYSISSVLQMLHPECKNLPEPNLLPGQLSHGTVGVKDGKVQWISMAFESVRDP